MISLDAGQYSPKDYLRKWFIFASGLSSSVAAAGSNATAQILISEDAPFECRALSLTILQANLVVSNFGGTFQITYAGKGEQVGNVAFAADGILGSGQRPYYLSPPQVFAQSMTINLTLTSNVATATTFHVSLHGNKLFAKA
jgi:hypothetical protein